MENEAEGPKFDLWLLPVPLWLLSGHPERSSPPQAAKHSRPGAPGANFTTAELVPHDAKGAPINKGTTTLGNPPRQRQRWGRQRQSPSHPRLWENHKRSLIGGPRKTGGPGGRQHGERGRRAEVRPVAPPGASLASFWASRKKLAAAAAKYLRPARKRQTPPRHPASYFPGASGARPPLCVIISHSKEFRELRPVGVPGTAKGEPTFEPVDLLCGGSHAPVLVPMSSSGGPGFFNCRGQGVRGPGGLWSAPRPGGGGL